MKLQENKKFYNKLLFKTATNTNQCKIQNKQIPNQNVLIALAYSKHVILNQNGLVI